MKTRVLSDDFSIKHYIIIAIRELITELPFEKITIQLIANRTGINRSTFYLHFKDKQAVLDHLTNQLLTEFVSHYRQPITKIDTQSSTISHTTYQICLHLQQNSDFYKERIDDQKFISSLYTVLYDALTEHIKNEALVTFTAYGTIGYLAKWLKEDCATPVEETAAGLQSIGEYGYNNLQ